MRTGENFKQLRQQVQTFWSQQGQINKEVFQKFDKMLSVENLINHRITNITQIFEKNLELLATMQDKVKDDIHFLNLLMHLNGLVSSHLIARSKIEYELSIVRSAVFSLAHGSLDPKLIPPDSLKTTLDQIQLELHRSHPGYQVIHWDPKYYYDSPFN